MHRLIVGPPGVGKSTLIQKLLQRLDRPVYGFYTQKELPEASGEASVYIHDPNRSRTYTIGNRVGVCSDAGAKGFPDAFNRAAGLLRNIPKGSVIVMDELGVMESAAAEFCQAVLAVLDGDMPVIAAVKPKETPFLQKVCSHPQAHIYPINETNRDDLFQTILQAVEEENQV